MPDITEAVLPGVGVRHVTAANGQRVAVVSHRTRCCGDRRRDDRRRARRVHRARRRRARVGPLARLAGRLGIPAIPLYLVAGLLVGRGGIAPLDVSSSFIELTAQIGVLLLLSRSASSTPATSCAPASGPMPAPGCATCSRRRSSSSSRSSCGRRSLLDAAAPG